MILALSGKMGSGKNTTANIIQYIIDSKESGFNLSESNYDDYIKNNHHLKCSFKQKSFAGKLKQIVALLTGCTIEDLESQEFKMKELGPEWNTYGIVRGNDNLGRQVAVQATPHLKDSIWLLASGDNQQVENILTYRKLLQVIGTDALRNVVHENIWVNALMADYHLRQKPPQITEKGAIFSFDSVYPNWIITDMRFPNELEAVKAKGGITIRVNRDNGTREIDLNPHPSETALDNHKFDYVIDNDGSLSDLVDKVKTILIKEKVI